MRRFILFMGFLLMGFLGFSQETVIGRVVDYATSKPLENVNIVNLNKVKGASTDSEGNFNISASVNDTLHFSYLGYKQIRIRVSNDWIRLGGVQEVALTELALALEEVVISQLKLTGYLEVDIEQVKLNNSFRYSISGLPTTGYEARDQSPSIANRVLGAVFNPVDFLYNTFGKKPREMRKLKKMKEDDEIRNLLATRFDREVLTALLQVDRVDLDQIITQCNYSEDFIKTANDLQILDAMSECYEEYRVLNINR